MKQVWVAKFALIGLFITGFASSLHSQSPAGKQQHLLYVASPGIRNYPEYGGLGLLVFDIDAGYKFVKRIPTWKEPVGDQKLENVKGIAASAKTGRVYISTINRIMAVDAITGKQYWDKAFDGGYAFDIFKLLIAHRFFPSGDAPDKFISRVNVKYKQPQATVFRVIPNPGTCDIQQMLLLACGRLTVQRRRKASDK